MNLARSTWSLGRRWKRGSSICRLTMLDPWTPGSPRGATFPSCHRLQSMPWWGPKGNPRHDQCQWCVRWFAAQHSCSGWCRRFDAAAEELLETTWYPDEGAHFRWRRGLSKHRQELRDQLDETTLSRGDRWPRWGDQSGPGGSTGLQ
ncbi:unnamed protein product, partial [Cladocopium goreaui]